jgi:hypothetical protein
MIHMLASKFVCVIDLGEIGQVFVVKKPLWLHCDDKINVNSFYFD